MARRPRFVFGRVVERCRRFLLAGIARGRVAGFFVFFVDWVFLIFLLLLLIVVVFLVAVVVAAASKEEATMWLISQMAVE